MIEILAQADVTHIMGEGGTLINQVWTWLQHNWFWVLILAPAALGILRSLFKGK